jgi:hypothetical protein
VVKKRASIAMKNEAMAVGSRRNGMIRNIAASIISFMLIGQARSDHGAGCTLDAKGIVTIKGTIRFLFSRVVPMRSETGQAD